MPYPAALVGHRTDPITHEVDARWTMAYAAGIGATGHQYYDTRASVVAHPVFPVCLEWPAVLALRAADTGGALGRDELLRGVHATHELTLHRPIRSPEPLTTAATVVAVVGDLVKELPRGGVKTVHPVQPPLCLVEHVRQPVPAGLTQRVESISEPDTRELVRQ